VKVLNAKGKWKTAMIKRLHKDGSFKIIYKDGTEESYVDKTRIMTPAQQAAAEAAAAAAAKSTTAANSNNNNNKVDETQTYNELLDSILDEGNFDEQEVTTDFKVQDDVDFDSWMDRDFQEDLQEVHINPEDSYFSSQGSEQSLDLDGSGGRIMKGHYNADLVGDFIVRFQDAPLGLTLSGNTRSEPEVIRIREGGNAEREGVQIGDILVQIDEQPVHDYEEAMRIITTMQYPVSINFKRIGKNVLTESGEIFMRNSRVSYSHCDCTLMVYIMFSVFWIIYRKLPIH
jgi:C-terminal processing protease CtpA/Prc